MKKYKRELKFSMQETTFTFKDETANVQRDITIKPDGTITIREFDTIKGGKLFLGESSGNIFDFNLYDVDDEDIFLEIED